MLKKFLLGFLFLLLNLPTYSYAQNVAATNGLNWIKSVQDVSGNWNTTTSSATDYSTTVTAIESLALLGDTSPSYTSGLNWIKNATAKSTTYLAPRIKVVAASGGDATADVNTLLSYKNPDSGWGGYQNHVTSTFHTALALQALRASNYPDLSISNNALAYLINTQNTDGGWGFSSGDDSSIYITAIVSATLQKFPQTIAIANAITKASAYLVSHQNIDGGFGATASGTAASTVFETAIAYTALIGDGQTQGLPLQRALTYLTSTQSINGSWNNDPYSTALALKALYLSENIPASPPPALTTGGVMATVVDGNTNTPLAGVTVALADNSAVSATTNATGLFVLSGIANGSQQITLSAAGYAPLTISATITAGDFINVGRIGLLATPVGGTVKGVVWDADLNAPFSGVTVRVVSGGITYDTLSGSDGSYSIANVLPGTITMGTPAGPANMPVYWNVQTTATLTPGGILIYNPRMSTTQPPYATLYLRTDKTLYKVGDNVALTINIQNNRSTGYPATLKLHVTDSLGTSVYDTNVAVNLTANTMLTQNSGFTLLATAKGGAYTAQAELFDANNVKIGTTTASFDLQIIPITVIPNLPAQFSQGENTITFNLTNNKSIAVTAGELAISLKDPDGQIITSASQPFTLATGESKTLTYALSIPALKFGTYTLSYTQSDESTNGQAVVISLPNALDVTALFNKYSYKKTETANLAISLKNTGRFNLDAVSLNVAVPDTGYTDTKSLTIGQGKTLAQQNNILLPGAVTTGEHATTVTLTLAGGSSINKSVPLLVSQSILGVTPTDGSRDVPVRASILVSFSENVASASITSGMVTLTANGVQVPGSVSLTADGSALIFIPQDKLAYATAYTFTIKAAAQNLSGNSTVIDLTSFFSTPVIDPDIVGYWPMDGDWKDYSGKGNYAEALGSVSFASGKVSTVKAGSFVVDSASFPGSGGYVPATTEYIADAPNTFSISFWAKPDAERATTTEANSGITGIGGQRYAIAPTNVSAFNVEGAGAGVSVGTNGISVFEHTGYYLPSLLVYDTPLSGWNHVVVVYNDKLPSLYLNGTLVRTAQSASTQTAVYPSAVFGDVFGDYTPGYGPYSGQMGEVTIHKRALSAQEIQTIYSSQARTTPAITIASPGQTVKYKPGEAGSATVTATSTIGLTKLYCSVSGAASDGNLAVDFDTAQAQITQQLSFHVTADAPAYAALRLTCVVLTSEGVFGTGEIVLQVADIEPPRVASSTPADNATNVSATMPISVTFNEVMNRTSFKSRDTFKLQRADNGAFVTGMSGFSTDGKTLLIIPSPALDASTQYILTIGAVSDIMGNVMATPHVVHFTTLQQTSLTITGQGSPTTPYVLAPGRYGALTLNNSTIVCSGGVTVDSLSLTNSTMSVTDTTAVAGNIAMDNSTLTLKKAMQVAGNISLQNNSVLTHFAATTTDMSKLDITAANMTIDATSKIDVSGKGYLGGYQKGDSSLSSRGYTDCYSQYYSPAPGENDSSTGRTIGNTVTGGSTTNNGGIYGGTGGISSGTTNALYGDPANPSELGSGGGGYMDENFGGSCTFTIVNSGGNGGGLLRLAVTNLSLLGLIKADGMAAPSGGGSGGSIRIDATNVSGTGSISANGGAGTNGGSGGGGRIAMYYTSMTVPSSSIKAVGGTTTHVAGAPGTVYLKNVNTKPSLVVDNNGIATSSVINFGGGDYASISISSGSNVVVSGDLNADSGLYLTNTQITVNGSLHVGGNLALSGSNIVQNGNLTVTGKITLDNISTMSLTSELAVSGALALSHQSVITHPTATLDREFKADITAASITIDYTSKIDVTGRGYLGGVSGSNTGTSGRTIGNTTADGSTQFSGGSYGGLGGKSAYGTPNTVYGDPANPNELGSGAGSSPTYAQTSGNGGGLVRITTGAMQIDGAIIADGGIGPFYNSGGSGGGIR
ncbi:MAG: Ig-like domain-containing protein, partial [Pedobacter sp.]